MTERLPTPPRDNREAIRAAVALLPELRGKLADWDAPGFRGMKVVQTEWLNTIINALQALSGDRVVDRKDEMVRVPIEKLKEWCDHMDNMEAHDADYHNLAEGGIPCRSAPLNSLIEVINNHSALSPAPASAPGRDEGVVEIVKEMEPLLRSYIYEKYKGMLHVSDMAQAYKQDLEICDRALAAIGGK